MSRKYKRLGLRREVLLFLPLAVLLLIIIASFNLFVYRNAIEELEQERLDEAELLATRAAAQLSAGPPPSAGRLEELAPHATAVVVFDANRRLIAQAGTPVPLFPGEWPDRAQAFAPLELEAPTIAAIAPFERLGNRFTVQIDLPAQRLATHRFSLKRILYLNIATLGALTILVLLFARRLLQPYDSLMAQARRIDAGASADLTQGDEVEFLVDTFERALTALDQRSGSDEADEIAVLERTLAPSLASGFMLLDRTGKVLTINEVGAALLGIEPPAAPRELGDLLADQPAVRQALGEAVAEGTVIQRHECEVASVEGRRVIGLTVHPLRRDDDLLRGFIVLYSDLTASQADQRQAQLDRSLKQLGELAAGVAHELRNGLATMKGYLGLIEHHPDEESILDYLQEMRTEGEHLERVLNDFLSFARPETTRLEALSLAGVVARAATDPALADIETRLECDADLPTIEGDAHLLERAVRNLLHNAAEAHRQAGTAEPIRLEVRSTAGGALVRVEDAGSGLDETVRERLFQPFASGRPDGVGMGLALAHRIARLHGGELTVVDGDEGGVVATLQLPVTIDT